MDAREAITVVAVSDVSSSREWYSKLFGKRPDLEPFPGNVEFRVGGAWLQISKGEVRPSGWSFQIEVVDLAKERDRIRRAGIDATEIKTVPGVIAFFDLKDPDGNPQRWFQVLTSDHSVTGTR